MANIIYEYVTNYQSEETDDGEEVSMYHEVSIEATREKKRKKRWPGLSIRRAVVAITSMARPSVFTMTNERINVQFTNTEMGENSDKHQLHCSIRCPLSQHVK